MSCDCAGWVACDMCKCDVSLWTSVGVVCAI